MGTQRHIPAYLLHGIVPDCLLDDYTFWQVPGDAIYGYKKEHAIARDSSAPLNMIVCTIVRDGATDVTGRCNARATASIRRVPAHCEGCGLLAKILCHDYLWPDGCTSSTLAAYLCKKES
jgi:hypothetical protein